MFASFSEYAWSLQGNSSWMEGHNIRFLLKDMSEDVNVDGKRSFQCYTALLFTDASSVKKHLQTGSVWSAVPFSVLPRSTVSSQTYWPYKKRGSTKKSSNLVVGQNGEKPSIKLHRQYSKGKSAHLRSIPLFNRSPYNSLIFFQSKVLNDDRPINLHH